MTLPSNCLLPMHFEGDDKGLEPEVIVVEVQARMKNGSARKL